MKKNKQFFIDNIYISLNVNKKTNIIIYMSQFLLENNIKFPLKKHYLLLCKFYLIYIKQLYLE